MLLRHGRWDTMYGTCYAWWGPQRWEKTMKKWKKSEKIEKRPKQTATARMHLDMLRMNGDGLEHAGMRMGRLEIAVRNP
jgi:hypothetical protein